MPFLAQVIEEELMKPEFLSAVIHRLQLEVDDPKERVKLLKEWGGRVGRPAPAWALTAVKLVSRELV